MIRKNSLIITAIFLGLITGVLASNFYTGDTNSQCEKAENAIQEQSNLSGAIACFEPGTVDFNLSEEVEEGSELECVCRRSYRGKVQFWSINRAN